MPLSALAKEMAIRVPVRGLRGIDSVRHAIRVEILVCIEKFGLEFQFRFTRYREFQEARFVCLDQIHINVGIGINLVRKLASSCVIKRENPCILKAAPW